MSTGNKTTKVLYISVDLANLEAELEQCWDYVRSIDLKNLVDRRGPKEMPNGKIVDAVICTKEQLADSKMKFMERIAKLLPAIQLMREQKAETEARKGFDTSGNVLLKDE
jgi:hypothetical protein